MPLLPAVIGIVLNHEQTQVLLVQRRDVSVWVLPGGGIEEGDTAQAALKREIQEETGYQVKILRQCAEYSPINRLASLTSVFICQIKAGKMCLSEETQAVAFYPLDKLPLAFFSLHCQWLKEALSQPIFIQRPLKEISYMSLCQYFFRHPWQVLRFAWTRFTKS